MTARDDVALAAAANDWVDRLVRWVESDALALARYESLGIARPWAAAAIRALPWAAVGATTAATATNTERVQMLDTFALVERSTSWTAVRSARDEAVAAGSVRVDPPDALWAVVDQLPRHGRLAFTGRVDMYAAVPPDQVVAGWCALDCIDAWRRDTTSALVVTTGLDAAEVDLLAVACADDDTPISPSPVARSLEDRGLLADGRVTAAGTTLHRGLVDHSRRLTTTPWERLGFDRTTALLAGSTAA